MPLQIIRNDITKMMVDAIVNAANTSLTGGGGVDGCIHREAGPGLLEECRTLGGCETGCSKITGAYNLPCKYVIHTVGPRYTDGKHGEKELLESCYRTALNLAKEHKCETVAFPLISSGIYGYPKGEALKVATDVISGFLLENDMLVYIVIFDKESVEIGEKLFRDISEFIDDNYVDEQELRYPEERRSRASMPVYQRSMPPASMSESSAPPAPSMSRMSTPSAPSVSQNSVPSASVMASVSDDDKKSGKLRGLFKSRKSKETKLSDDISVENLADVDMQVAMDVVREVEDERTSDADAFFSIGMGLDEDFGNMSLEELLGQVDESFSEMLLRKIDERGMKDSECYKKANIDRKLFSKIRSDINYKPSKPTVIAFAIALELTLSETKDMLMKAGFALSHSNKFDLIIEYFISKANYDVFEINQALFAFDQNLLGV